MAGTKSDIFYWSDWLSDQELRSCSALARALWIDMLCICATSRERGKLLIGGQAVEDQYLADLCRIPAADIPSLKAELIHKGVCSVDRNGVIYNRRMIRDVKKKKSSAKGGRKGGVVTHEKGLGIHDTRGGTRHPMARDPSHSHNQKDSSSLPSSTIRGGVNSGSGGRGGVGGDTAGTSLPLDQRMTIFGAKLADQINRTSRSSQGFRIVACAQDRHHPDHRQALAACKAAAQALGKGWPRYWPLDRHAE